MELVIQVQIFDEVFGSSFWGNGKSMYSSIFTQQEVNSWADWVHFALVMQPFPEKEI